MAENVFSAEQRKVLGALCDAVFQGHEGAEAEEIIAAVPVDAPEWQKEKVRKFATSKFTDLPESLDYLSKTFVAALSSDNVEALGLVLTLMSTRAGTLVLTGHATPFADLTLEQRETVLLGWKSSKLPILRKAYRGFVSIALYVAYTFCDDIALAIGYPAAGDPLRTADSARLRKHYEYQFEQIVNDYQYFDCDVLIVGSGAGGGVVASELSQKGWKTLVVEKGEYVKPEDMKATPADGLTRMYEYNGLTATEDGSMNILAGSTFGGGTTINWSASLRPQHFLREEWAKVYGLPHFLSKDYAASVEYVCDRMGVASAHLQHNKGNQILLDGSHKLGYHKEPIPQNTGGQLHPCGFCSFGCPYCEKQGGTVSWLKDAALNGAKFFVDTEVVRLLFASSINGPSPTPATLNNYTPTASRRRCIGALVKNKHGKFAIVRAKEATVVSGGSLNTPAILMKSGLKGPRIGKNLHLHPCSFVTGYYDEQINPWEGAIMTALTNVHENKDGQHYGVKIEVMMSFPGGAAATFNPWKGSKEHKKTLLQYNHSFTLLPIARDRDSGSIFVDKAGKPRIDYTPSAYDCESILNGVIASAEIHLAAGAKRIALTITGVDDYVPAPGHKYLADPAWLAWVENARKQGIRPTLASIGSAHQMGSCAMGTKPTNSAIDPRARVWGTEMLYVADASVFPTASGVNPMITNLATSHSIAQFIHADVVANQSQAQHQAHL